MRSREDTRTECFGVLADSYETVLTPLFTRVRATLLRRFVGKRILDVGVGRGTLLKAYAVCGHEVTGCDLSPRMIAFAQATNPHAQLFVSSAESLSFDAHTFDSIILSEVVYYIFNWDAFLKKAFVWLKPQGKIILIFGNQRYNFFYPLAAKLGLRLPDTLGEKTISIDTLKKTIVDAFPMVRVKCFGGSPFLGWSTDSIAINIFPLQAIIISKE